MIIGHGHAYFFPGVEPSRWRVHDYPRWLERILFREENFSKVFSILVRRFFRAVDEEVPIENVGGGRRLGEDARFGIFEEDLELFLEAEGSGHLLSAAACVVRECGKKNMKKNLIEVWRRASSFYN